MGYFDLLPYNIWLWLFDYGLYIILADILFILLIVVGHIFWELKGYWRER